MVTSGLPAELVRFSMGVMGSLGILKLCIIV
jgi:hypothetical protein